MQGKRLGWQGDLHGKLLRCTSNSWKKTGGYAEAVILGSTDLNLQSGMNKEPLEIFSRNGYESKGTTQRTAENEIER